MKFIDLVKEAIKENKEKEFHAGEFIIWLLEKDRIGDLRYIIETDAVKTIPLRKAYGGKNSILRLQQSDEVIQITTLMGTMGYVKEAQEIFEVLLARTPDDASALNNYGFILLNEMVIQYQTDKKYDKNKLRIAQDKISNAATIDKFLHEEPLAMPAYRNLCLFRAVEATYYEQISAYLPAFLVAWMSVEMSVYRIFYSHLKENQYSKSKIDDLLRWNIDTIAEVLYLNKCDPQFVEWKDELDALRRLRNRLMHGDDFDLSERDTKRCIDLALRLTFMKQDLDFFLT
jgi:hypothetical protein